MLFLTNGFAIAVISSFPDGPPGTTGLTTSTVFDLRIGWAVALVLGLAGLDHLLLAWRRGARVRGAVFSSNMYEHRQPDSQGSRCSTGGAGPPNVTNPAA